MPSKGDPTRASDGRQDSVDSAACGRYLPIERGELKRKREEFKIHGFHETTGAKIHDNRRNDKELRVSPPARNSPNLAPKPRIRRTNARQTSNQTPQLTILDQHIAFAQTDPPATSRQEKGITSADRPDLPAIRSP